LTAVLGSPPLPAVAVARPRDPGLRIVLEVVQLDPLDLAVGALVGHNPLDGLARGRVAAGVLQVVLVNPGGEHLWKLRRSGAPRPADGEPHPRVARRRRGHDPALGLRRDLAEPQHLGVFVEVPHRASAQLGKPLEVLEESDRAVPSVLGLKILDFDHEKQCSSGGQDQTLIRVMPGRSAAKRAPPAPRMPARRRGRRLAAGATRVGAERVGGDA
jgi:hypothetical protein